MQLIGYWLNRTDKALMGAMNGMLVESGLTRTAWQARNVVRGSAEATGADVDTFRERSTAGLELNELRPAGGVVSGV
ncbi:hypothetical protein F7Q99_25990 [Streptomyces kaniharaensis]|uniref:Uncharacterized protein n=1 Tax=Streptomyces kaniharaensis TaxID=212423 RepID=A0A6N7KZ33_9ACTN|nr:hypothetical protein [Streptomyces kaniharaensis]MQS15627.1 hypothetical protein [Streptomyces kaniharaensis]